MTNVKRIDSQEYIGNSLSTITSNFALLESKLCTLQYGTSSISTINDLISSVNQSFDGIDFSISSTLKATLCQVRMSLSPTSSVVYDNYVGSNIVYIHPYDGNIVSLYDDSLNIWQEYFINEPLGFYLTVDGTQYGVSLASNVVYDVFIYVQNDVFKLKYVSRPHINTFDVLTSDAEIRDVVDGVIVNYNDYTMRYIGTIYTSGSNIAEQTSNIKTTIQSVWNKYNQHESVVSFQTQCDFIIGEPTNVQIRQTYYVNTDNTINVILNESTINSVDVYTNNDCTSDTVFDLNLNAGVYTMTLSSLHDLDPSYITNITISYLS